MIRPTPLLAGLLRLGVLLGMVAAHGPSIARANTQLLPQDHTILWPIKFSAAKDPLFDAAGDGLCNAPNLVSDGILDGRTVTSIFNASLNGNGSSCADDPQWSDLIFDRTEAQLLEPNIPLILVRGVPPKACDAKVWHVVALRVDPCQNIVENKKTGVTCRPQLRLVLQPFEKSLDGLNVVLDFSLHLIFEVPNLNALRADLLGVAAQSRKSEQAKPWEQTYDGQKVFRPHHGLRNELSTCGGPVAGAIKGLIKNHALSDRLSSAAVMGSSFAVKQWTFMAFKANPGAPLQLTEVHGTRFDNFSESLFGDGKPSLNVNLATASALPNLYQELSLAALHKPVPQATATAALGKINAVLNPLEMSQLGTSCTSCHLAPQTLMTLERLSSVQAAAAPKHFATPVWPGFRLHERSFANLRNLGYGPGFSLSINQRTINEVMLAQQWLEQNR